MKIECSDNLPFMKKIKSNTIDLIYCDILYGTGNNFDYYKDLQPIKQDIDNHYIPRINEMHRILKDTGSIYLQMDTYISHWIRLIMDDIFGYNNFRNEIIWKYISGGISKKYFARKHDNILFYTKSKKYTFIIQKENRKNINYCDGEDEKGEYIWYIKPNTNSKVPNGVKSYNESYITDVWNIPIINPQAKERCGYPTQKPLELIERIIKSSSNENDLVADFYLGSGTTAIACKKLNRNFIGCDINKEAIDIANKRLNKG